MTSTDELSIHGITSGTARLASRSAQPHSIGKNNALIAAVVRALTGISPPRAARLAKPYREAQRLLNPDVELGNLKAPVEIRTDSRDLIEAATFLCAEDSSVDDESQVLRKQLLRFDVHWVLLPLDGVEVQALRRWGELARLPFGSDEANPSGCNRGVISCYPSPNDSSRWDPDEANETAQICADFGEPVLVAA